MGIFDDKKFEQLDWMTQVTETIDHPLNELLSKLPDRMEIPAQEFLTLIDNGWNNNVDFDQVVKLMVSIVGKDDPHFNWHTGLIGAERDAILKCFDWEDFPANMEVDLENRIITSDRPIIVVKVKTQFADEELIPLIAEQATDHLFRGTDPNQGLTRMNEILDLLGDCEEAYKSRSGRLKLKAIKNRLHKILLNNEWRIRDASLAQKVCKWAMSYIQYENMASFINFTKVKVMTHNNMPIYSIEEEK